MKLRYLSIIDRAYKSLMKNKNNKEMKMTKKIFLSLTLLFCCQAYMNAMEICVSPEKTTRINHLLDINLYDELKKNPVNQCKIQQLIENGADASGIIKYTNLINVTLSKASLHIGLEKSEVNFNTTCLLIKNASNLYTKFTTSFYSITTQQNILESLIYGNKTVNEKIKVIKELYKYGFDIRSIDSNDKFNALHYLCDTLHPDDKDYYKIAEVLIEDYGVDVNGKNIFNNTPLHELAKQAKFYYLDHPNSFEIFKNMVWILRENKARFDIENNKRQIPHDIVKTLPEVYSKLFLP